jgi:cell division protein FtsB
MKTILHVLIVLALAHFLALLAFVGWLGMNGRLSVDRVERVREIFSETVAAENVKAEIAAEEARIAEAAAQEIDEGELLPVDSSELLEQRIHDSRLDRQRIERLKREVEDLQRTVKRDQAELDASYERLQLAEAGFDDRRAKIAAIEGDEQFQKAVGVLNGLKPDDAKVTIEALLNQTDGPDGQDAEIRAVAYLNAMNARQRTKVMAEFVADDPALAADLLERLRTKGLSTPETAMLDP